MPGIAVAGTVSVLKDRQGAVISAGSKVLRSCSSLLAHRSEDPTVRNVVCFFAVARGKTVWNACCF
ncbi:MAG: hypothetical protein ACK4VP_09200 [Nitrospira sp.]